MNLRINDKIGQDVGATNKILKSIKDNKTVLLIAPMGSGKTYLILNALKEMALKSGKKVVIVIPGVKQLESMELEYGIKTVCDGKDYHNDNIVATTPDSLPKVMAKLKQDDFYLVVDEAHEKYSSVIFRKAFKNIGPAEDKAYKVIYTTATPQNLDVDKFDDTITVTRSKGLSTMGTILEVDRIDTDTIKTIIGKYQPTAGQLVIFNNNIKENEVLASHFHSEKVTSKTVLLEDHQLDLIGASSGVREIQEITVLNKAKTIKASDRETEIAEAIKNGYIPEDVNMLFSTSAIRAGININNNPNTTVIVVCKQSDFNLLNEIQTIGRFRNSLRRVIFVVRKVKDRAGLEYKTLGNVRKSKGKVVNDIFKLISENLNDALYVEDLKGKCFAERNEDTGLYEVDHIEAHAQAFDAWAKSLLNFPRVLTKQLLSNQAIHFSDIDIKDFNEAIDEELKEVLKAAKEDQEEELASAIDFINKLDDDVKTEVLNYSVNQNKADSELVYNMNLWSKLGKKKKLEQIADKLHNGDILKAFNTLATEDITVINKNIRQVIATTINRDIKNLGVEAYLQGVAKGSREIRQAKIRYELMEIEKKQGRVTAPVLENLAKTLVREGYIQDKVLSKKDIPPEQKEKALARVARGLGRDVKLIYNFKNGDTRISSAKTE